MNRTYSIEVFEGENEPLVPRGALIAGAEVYADGAVGHRVLLFLFGDTSLEHTKRRFYLAEPGHNVPDKARYLRAISHGDRVFAFLFELPPKPGG